MQPPYPTPTPPARSVVPAPGATATLARPVEQHATEPEAEGIRKFFRERLFRTGSLSFSLQVAVGCAIGFAVGAALLILFSHSLRPTVAIHSSALALDAPLATIITIRLFWILGWSLALTGALHGNWLTRAVVLLLFAFMVGQDFVAQDLTNVVALTYGWPLIVLALYAVTIIVLTARARAGRGALPAHLSRVSFPVISALLLLYYALLYFSLAVLGGGGLALIAKSIVNNFSALTGLILPIYFLAGSDFVEWAQVSSGEVSHWLQLRGRTPWLLFVATALVAGVILWNLLSQRGDFQAPPIFAALDIIEMMLIGGVVCAVLLLLARWGRLGRLRSVNIPFPALVVGALSALGLVTLVVMLDILTNQSSIGQLLAAAFTTAVFFGNGTILLGVIPLLVAVLVGLPLLLLGRRNRPVLAVSGFFLLVFGLRSALLYLPNILQLFELPTRRLPVHVGSFSAHTTIPNLNLPMIQIITALFTLLYLVWLLVRRAPRGYIQDILAQLFILNVGLQALVWLSQLLTASAALSPAALPAIAALLLVLAFLWDLLTSGEQTNGNSRRLPRYVRVCLYVGYSILSITITLYLSIAPTATSAAFDPESWTPSGVTDLGVAVLLAGFIIGLCRARARATQTGQAPQPDALPAGQAPASR